MPLPGIVLRIQRAAAAWLLVLVAVGGSLFAQAPAAVAARPGASGLLIIPTFDSTITADPRAAEIENTINAAIGVYESLFSDPVTVSIYFRYSKAEAGGSQAALYGDIPWADYIRALQADAKSANDANTLNSLAAITPGWLIELTSANARAVGLERPGFLSANGAIHQGGAFDGIVTLETDALPVVEREIGEVLGLRPRLPWGTAGIGSLDLSQYFAPVAPEPGADDQARLGLDLTPTSPETVALDVTGYDLRTASTPAYSAAALRVDAITISQSSQGNTSNAPGALAANASALPASTGLKINVTYGATVPLAAQTAFNSVKSVYESLFSNGITVNISANFGTTGLGGSST